MRILILSRRQRLYSTRRLTEAGRALGHTVSVVDPLECNLVLAPGEPFFYYRNRPLRRPELVIPRIGISATEYGLAVLAQFELAGVPVLNDSEAIYGSRDKLRSLQLLSEGGVPVPRTVMARKPQDIDEALRMVGGPPVVLKLPQGTQGVGVMLAETREAVESMLETLWNLGQHVLVQEFVREARGRDLRVVVLDGKVLAAIRREASGGEFRANLHRGGSGVAIVLPRSYAAQAVRAAGLTGLRLAGVDLLETARGPMVLEINSSPGLEGVERATGLDVARRIIEGGVRFAARGLPRRAVAGARG